MAKKKDREYFVKKSFLNQDGHHSVAAVGYTMEVIRWTEKDKHGAYAYCDLILQDCSNTVHLALDIDSERELENSRYKLQVLKEIVEQAIVDLEKANDLYQKYRSDTDEDDDDIF